MSCMHTLQGVEPNKLPATPACGPAVFPTEVGQLWPAEWGVCTGGCLLFLPCTAAKAAQSPVALASSKQHMQAGAGPRAGCQRHEQAEGKHFSAQMRQTSHSIVRTGGRRALHPGTKAD